MWIRSFLLIGLTLTGVKSQGGDVQPQYIYNPTAQQQTSFQSFQTFQPPQQTFVEDNDIVDDSNTNNENIDDFIANIPAPSPTPPSPFFIDSSNNNNFVSTATPVFIENTFNNGGNQQFFVDQNGQLFTANFDGSNAVFVNQDDTLEPVEEVVPAGVPAVIPAVVPAVLPAVVSPVVPAVVAVTPANSDAVNFPTQEPTVPALPEDDLAVPAPSDTSSADATSSASVATATEDSPAPSAQPATAAVTTNNSNDSADSDTAESRQQQCYVRSCDQSITGRNLDYDRALKIVQDEEYLSAADLSVIRLRKRHLWSKDQSSDDDDEANNLIFSPVHRVAKRSFDYCFSQNSNSTTCLPVASGALTAGLLAIIFGGAKLVGLFSGKPRVPHAPIEVPPIIVMPPLGEAPPNSPQPGQPGGGEVPASNPYAAALAPPGTVPVAVFPPFTNPRTYPAVCVTFSERTEYEPEPKPSYHAPETYNSYNHYFRQKRSPFFKFRLPNFGGPRRRPESYRTPDQIVYRKFGFRCLVTLVNARCQLGVTCDENGNKLGPEFRRRHDPYLRRQTGEEFSSDAPPDCRVQQTTNGCN